MTFKGLLLSGVVCLAISSCKHASAPTDMGGGGIIQVLINPSSAAIQVGQKVTLRATVTGPSGISQTVTWQSLNPDFATVTSAGVVSGLAEGTAVIRAAWFSDPDQFSTVEVLVTTTVLTDSTGAGSLRTVVRPAGRDGRQLTKLPPVR